MQYIKQFNNHHSLCIIQTNHVHSAKFVYVAIYVFFQLLFLEWAHPRNFYKKQPLWLIKRYFGDKVSSSSKSSSLWHGFHQNQSCQSFLQTQPKLFGISLPKVFFLKFSFIVIYVFVFFIFGVSSPLTHFNLNCNLFKLSLPCISVGKPSYNSSPR